MKNITYLTIFMLFICISSCKSKVYGSLEEYDSTESIQVIKFMGTITTQPYGVNEKSFWAFKDEHAFLKIRNNNFIESVKKLKDNNFDEFKEYKYAFIIKKGNQIDTLYSNNSLKTWIFKKKLKEIYYFDKDGTIAEDLRNTYSFFRDCW